MTVPISHAQDVLIGILLGSAMTCMLLVFFRFTDRQTAAIGFAALALAAIAIGIYEGMNP